MFSMFRKIATAAVVLIGTLTLTVQPITAQGSRYSLRIENASQFAIYQIFISSSDSPYWTDQLGRNVLVSGDSFTITNVPPGEYDIRFVDQDGDSCTLAHVNIFHDTSWRLTTNWLLQCEFR